MCHAARKRQHRLKAVITGTKTTDQIRIYCPIHYGIGSATKVTTSKPSRLATSPDLDKWGHDPQLLKTRRSSVTQGSHQLTYDALGDKTMMTKNTTETMLNRTTGEPSPCTVILCHTLSQHGHKTMTIAMTGGAPEDGVACKPN